MSGPQKVGAGDTAILVHAAVRCNSGGVTGRAGGRAQCRTMIPALTGVPRMAILAAMISRRTLPIASPIVLLDALLLAGCTDRPLSVGHEKDKNFPSFNHSFTAAADAGKYGQ